jgi:hypothetical protein
MQLNCLDAVLLRTPRVGLEPTQSNLQTSIHKTLTKKQNSVLSTCLDNLVQIYPDLAALVKAWPKLPEQVKNTIIELVKTSTKTKENK